MVWAEIVMRRFWHWPILFWAEMTSDQLVVSGPHDNFDKLPKKTRRTGNFVWSGAEIFMFLFTDKKTRVVGLTQVRSC